MSMRYLRGIYNMKEGKFMYIEMKKTEILGKDQRYFINHLNNCYFVGKDLCAAMDYKNHNSILKKYVSDINKQKHEIATNKGIQTAILLNEKGTRELLNHSCKEYAIKFRELLSNQSFIEIIKGYQEVSIQQNDSKEYQEVHEKLISAHELYEFSESDTNFNEWLLQATLYYSYETDYFINDDEIFFKNDIAKEIMIHENNKKGKMYRQNLIAAEKERNSLREEINNRVQQATEYIEHNQSGTNGYIE